jgi:hypothetical protein
MRKRLPLRRHANVLERITSTRRRHACADRLKSHLAEMRAVLRDATIVELPGYDYGVHFLVPELVVAKVRKFLTALASSAVS